MENSNNKKWTILLLISIIGLLSILCVLFATDILSFNFKQNINDNTDTNNNINDNTTQNENSELPEWADYLLSQNITEITYEDGKVDDDEICTTPKTMTKEQLKSVLLKMTNSKLKKYDAGGFGGQCWNGITVRYDNQKFEIFMGNIIVIDKNDSNVVSLLEKEQYTLENSTMPDPLWVYKYDWDTSYIDTIF